MLGWLEYITNPKEGNEVEERLVVDMIEYECRYVTTLVTSGLRIIPAAAMQHMSGVGTATE